MYNETEANHGHNGTAREPVLTGAAPLAEGYPMPATEPLTDEQRRQYTGVKDADTDVHDAKTDRPAVPEGLTEHKDGESVKEWLKNDWEQTKEDLHLGGKSKS